MTRTDWMKTKSRQLLKYSSAAAMTALVACAALGTPTTAVAQHVAEPQGLLGLLCPQSPQGPEGSWLYTVTIPGFATFQGVETYSAGRRVLGSRSVVLHPGLGSDRGTRGVEEHRRKDLPAHLCRSDLRIVQQRRRDWKHKSPSDHKDRQGRE
jgi:hypothetical protein